MITLKLKTTVHLYYKTSVVVLFSAFTFKSAGTAQTLSAATKAKRAGAASTVQHNQSQLTQ